MNKNDYVGFLALLPQATQKMIREGLALGPQGPKAAVRNGKTGEIFIYDEIVDPELEAMGLGISAKGIRAQLQAVGDVGDLLIHVNSPGGDVNQGFAGYGALMQHPARKTVINEGITASAATWIACAGDRVVMMPEARMMIHNAWAVSLGDHRDMARMSQQLGSLDESQRAIYSRRTGLPIEQLARMMDETTYLSAKQAVEQRFADEIMQLPSKAKQPEASALEPQQVLSAYQLAQLRASARK
jgi:ATP-dependent protease ClpP protease subunit